MRWKTSSAVSAADSPEREIILRALPAIARVGCGEEKGNMMNEFELENMDSLADLQAGQLPEPSTSVPDGRQALARLLDVPQSPGVPCGCSTPCSTCSCEADQLAGVTTATESTPTQKVLPASLMLRSG